MMVVLLLSVVPWLRTKSLKVLTCQSVPALHQDGGQRCRPSISAVRMSGKEEMGVLATKSGQEKSHLTTCLYIAVIVSSPSATIVVDCGKVILRCGEVIREYVYHFPSSDHHTGGSMSSCTHSAV